MSHLPKNAYFKRRNRTDFLVYFEESPLFERLERRLLFFILLAISFYHTPRRRAMPVLDTERTAMPRSVLRYRPIHVDAQNHPGQPVVRSRRNIPDARQTVAPFAPGDLGQEETPRRSRPATRQAAPVIRPQRHFHPLFWLGLGLLALVLGWIGLNQAVTWGTGELNTLQYGTTRTFQMDAFLGNGDSQAHPSHLLALNLNGEILLEVFPSGDVSHVQSYILTTLTGPGSDEVVVTIQLFDPGHTGKPDLIIHVGEIESLLVSAQGSFRPPTPEERQQLLQQNTQ